MDDDGLRDLVSTLDRDGDEYYRDNLDVILGKVKRRIYLRWCPRCRVQFSAVVEYVTCPNFGCGENLLVLDNMSPEDVEHVKSRKDYESRWGDRKVSSERRKAKWD